MRLRSILSVAAIAALAAAVVAIGGCGSGGSQATAMQSGSSGGGSTAASASASTSTTAGGGATIDVGSTSLGKILVDSQGRTVYLFQADKRNMSNCSGACSTIWSPVTSSGKATAGNGVNAGMIGSAAGNQVTYNGHPLYTYVGDQKPGDTNGQNLDQFGAEWYVLSTSGNKVDNG